MALPSYLYGDPCDVLDRKQQAKIKKSCEGCMHGFSLSFKDGVVSNGCGKGKKYGRRCELYLKESANV